MTRKRLRWALLIPLLLAVCGGAQAQITAAQSIPGFYVQQGTDGCTAVTGCFIPYSATYPLPTTGGGGSSNASVGATGSAVPGSATYLGINIAGALTGLTAGQATMANSVPVVIASNQSAVPVTQGTTPWVDDITQWANVALGPPSNYGTSPGAVAVPGVNAFVTNVPAVGQNGAWTVQPGNTPNTVPWLVATTPTAVAPTVGASGSITSLVLDASPTTATGGIKHFHAENATTTIGYCIIYNGTTAPSTGALTAANVLKFQLLPASGYCDWQANSVDPPVAASVGAVFLVSSGATPYTYTTGVITASMEGLAQ